MNFRPHDRDEPELNLIPLIDVLIILLIFLVMTTTFAQQHSLAIHLPETGATVPPKAPEQAITLNIDDTGRFRVADKLIDGIAVNTLRDALRNAAGEQKDPVIQIEADRHSTHQSLISALEALSQLGFKRISFTALSTPSH
jgi:biopolymer transport protein ExbD